MTTGKPVPLEGLSAMGRDISIGYLYDIRTGQVVNRSLWNEDIRTATTVEKQKKTTYKIAVSDTYEQRATLMDVSAEVALTIEGFINLSGSAHYLNAKNKVIRIHYNTIDIHPSLPFRE